MTTTNGATGWSQRKVLDAAASGLAIAAAAGLAMSARAQGKKLTYGAG